jgi:hypothetical protein
MTDRHYETLQSVNRRNIEHLRTLQVVTKDLGVIFRSPEMIMLAGIVLLVILCFVVYQCKAVASRIILQTSQDPRPIAVPAFFASIALIITWWMMRIQQ